VNETGTLVPPSITLGVRTMVLAPGVALSGMLKVIWFAAEVFTEEPI
jgi:hypothetical protein